MSILTEEEMFKMIVDNPDETMLEFAQAIESAVLAKLAGMELPEPDDRFVFAGLDWHRATPEYFKQSQWQTNCIAAYSATQLHQAYAQGAASQLSAEPVFFAYQYSDGTYHDGSATEHSAGMKSLYTLKQPK